MYQYATIVIILNGTWVIIEIKIKGISFTISWKENFSCLVQSFLNDLVAK